MEEEEKEEEKEEEEKEEEEEEEEKEEEEEGEEWWEGVETTTIEDEARERNITDLFDPSLLGMYTIAQSQAFLVGGDSLTALQICLALAPNNNNTCIAHQERCMYIMIIYLQRLR